MDNQKNDKDKPADYSKFFEKEKPSHAGSSKAKKKKKFSLISLKNTWLGTDKKTKIELLIFLLIIVSIIVILIFYFSSPKNIVELPPPSLPAEF